MGEGEISVEDQNLFSLSKIISGITDEIFIQHALYCIMPRISHASSLHHFTYMLTEGVVGAPQMTSQPVSSIILTHSSNKQLNVLQKCLR